jgi:hypothetical protein
MAQAGVRRDAEGIWFDGQVGGGAGGGSGGDPSSGYEEVNLNFVTDSGIFTLTVLAKSGSKETVEAFGSGDSRLLLAINTSGVVRKSKGYLKE